MPWHVANNPNIDYEKRIVKVGPEEIHSAEESSQGCPKIMNMGVKKFRNLVKRKGNQPEFQVFQLVQSNNLKTENSDFKKKLLESDNQLKKLLNEYQEVFQDDLPAGLLPEIPVHHEIEIEKGLSHRINLCINCHRWN